MDSRYVRCMQLIAKGAPNAADGANLRKRG